MIILDLIQYEKECDTIMKDTHENSKDITQDQEDGLDQVGRFFKKGLSHIWILV